MNFEILSHASIHIAHRGKSVLIDPWLRGSAYWRSWWNFPPVDIARVENLNPDFIYLTHIHWDHFHGPSLRAFRRNTPILITTDRYTRMRRDLNALGFMNVIELVHAKPFQLGEDFSLTPYLFSPLGDSAVVVASSKTTILNANDCKIVGLPLKQLLDQHPRIDFALRSHSSANSRALYSRIDGALQPVADNRQQYLRSFANFMAAVKPRYAIPFASNHCHLHRETFQYNDAIVSPIEVRDYFAHHSQTHSLATELVVMLPSSCWDSETGFTLAPLTLFDDRAHSLNALRESNATLLNETYRREAKIHVREDDVKAYFQSVFAHSHWLVRRLFKDCPIFIATVSRAVIAGEADNTNYWRVDVYRREVAACAAKDFAMADARIEIPAAVFKHAMRANMFGHVSISKRVKFQAKAHVMKQLQRFELLLCFEESELIPLRRHLSWRAISSYLPRWRELVLYLQVVYYRFIRGVSFQDIEQHLLAKQAGATTRLR